MSLLVREIGHRYGGVDAVAGASLAVAEGEIVALFGPSGCGKTTLLRVIAGLERAHAGEIAIGGAVMASPSVFVPPEKRPVGFVFQDYVLFPHLTAGENAAFGLASLSRDERDRRAAAELGAAGLSGLESRYPHQLSGGQQQRVALARAMARRPRAMLLDEPFSGIDAVLRRKLRVEMREILKASGAATVLVTHDPDEALALGDRVAVMKQGRIIETASPQSLFETPQTAEGAAIFAGAQTFEGDIRNETFANGLATASAAGRKDGAATLVALPGAVTIAPHPDGALVVLDARFAGPDWRIEAVHRQAGHGGARLFGASAGPLTKGASVTATFDAARLRIFPRP